MELKSTLCLKLYHFIYILNHFIINKKQCGIKVKEMLIKLSNYTQQQQILSLTILKMLKIILLLACIFLSKSFEQDSKFMTVAWTKRYLSNQSFYDQEDLLNKMFNQENGVYFVSRFKIDKVKLYLIIADATKSYYIKRLILEVFLDNMHLETTKKPFRGMKSSFQLQEKTENETLSHILHLKTPQKMYEYSFNPQQNNLAISYKDVNVSLTFIPQQTTKFFKDYNQIRNIIFILIVLFMLTSIIYWRKRDEIPSDRVHGKIYTSIWALGLVPISFMFQNYNENLEIDGRWQNYRYLIFISLLLFGVTLLSLMKIHVKQSIYKKNKIFIEVSLYYAAVMHFWFNWFTLLIFTVLHFMGSPNLSNLWIPNGVTESQILTRQMKKDKKYQQVLEKCKSAASLLIFVLYILVLWLDTINPGAIGYQEISFTKSNIFWPELSLLLINCFITVKQSIIMTKICLHRRKQLLDTDNRIIDEQYQKLSD